MSHPTVRALLLASLLGLVPAAGCTGLVPGGSSGGGGDDDVITVDAGVAEVTPDAGPTGPTVAMDRLVVQSQVEPFRGDQPSLPGDADVELVQGALKDKGYSVGVDGYFGNGTSAAYAKFQTSLGYSGLSANGIPGPSSLAMLGKNHFDVTHPIDIGDRRSLSGQTVNQRTYDMIKAADALVANSIVISQGSYNVGGVAASAGTHDGGGAIDVSVSALTTTQRWQTVKALRTVGFAAWLRTPAEGDWPYHIHAIAIGDTDLSSGARNQVADYFVGKNGLASHLADSTPTAYRAPFTWWEKYKAP